MTQKQFHEIICLSQSQDSTCVQNDINNNKCLNKKKNANMYGYRNKIHFRQSDNKTIQQKSS